MAYRRIATILNIHPGEGRLISLLIALYFTLAMGFVFVQSMAFGVFIGEYGVEGLPYSYIAVSIFASLAAYLYIRLSERVSTQIALRINLAFLGLISFLAWLGLKSPFSHQVAFSLPLLFQVVVNMGNLVVWSLALRLFDFRQGKRLFPLLGVGVWSANTIGGLFVTPLVAWIGAVNLLLLAVTSIALSLFVLSLILKAYFPVGTPLSQPPARKTAHSQKRSAGLLSNRYILLIFVYIFIWWVAFFFLDNIFYDRAAARYPDADQLTAFTGQLLSIIGIVALISSTFLNSRIIKRFGLRVALAAMPLAVTLAVGLLALGGSMGAALVVTFGIGTFAKVINVAFGFSLSQSANAIVYQSLADNLRSRVQATAEGVVQPIAIGVAGLSLLALTAGFGLDFSGLSYVFLVLGAIWMITIILLSGNYVKALTQVITRRRFGVSPNVPVEPTAVVLLRNHLSDPHPGAAIYAMTKLGELDQQYLVSELPSLIRHLAHEVRCEAYARIERLQQREYLGVVREQLASEELPVVKGAALRALGAIGDDASVQPLTDALNGTDPHLLRGALVGLLKYGRLSNAEQRLNRLLASESSADRTLAAQVLGELDQKGFLGMHNALIRDLDPRVRREALKSAARTNQPSLVPAMIEACDLPATSHAAGHALASIGVDVLPEIESAISKAGASRLRLLTLVWTLGHIGGPKAQELLLSLDGVHDSDIRSSILKALCQSGYRAEDPSELEAAIKMEINQAAWLSAGQVELGDTDATHLLYKALVGELAEARDRVLLLISFAFDAHSVQQVRQAYLAGSGTQRSYALEIIDTLLPSGLRTLVLPLFEDLTPIERTQRLASHHPPAQSNNGDRLRTLMCDEQFTPWTRACAIYTAAHGNALSPPDPLKILSSDIDPLISETARWAYQRLETSPPKGNNAMLTTIEKVIILKTVNIFSQTPDDVLADVATMLDEVDVLEGEIIIRQGDPGDSMYIIVDGKVSVQDNGRLLNYLGESDVFGEMALLDTEPRSASVIGVEPTRLLRLDQASFYDLIADRPEVATGIIRVLMGHLRNRMNENGQLDFRVKELESRLAPA